MQGWSTGRRYRHTFRCPHTACQKRSRAARATRDIKKATVVFTARSCCAFFWWATKPKRHCSMAESRVVRNIFHDDSVNVLIGCLARLVSVGSY